MDRSKTALIVIDVQDKLFAVMPESEQLKDNLVRLVRGARILGLPVVWAEQLPDKLGPTIAPLAEALDGLEPSPKSSFSVLGDPSLKQAVAATGCDTFLLAGIETHVCVYQTCRDLADAGYAVEVVCDTVTSRSPTNRDTGLQRCCEAGASLTSVETVLFELLGDAADPAFKDLLKVIK